MTDTPYTLKAETTCDDAVSALLATLIEYPFTAKQINVAFAKVGYVRAPIPEARWCKHCGETTIAGLCRAPDPVGHEARRRAYQEGHRDGMEEAAQYLDGLHRTANKQHNYYQYAANCIRLATKPAQEPNRSQKMHEAGYTRRPSPFGCEECGMVFGGVAQLQAHDCTKPAQEGDHV